MSLFFHIKEQFQQIKSIDEFLHLQFQLIPRARDEDNEDNLAMRTADALWMLGRQWQFGEFEAENNGSPVLVKYQYSLGKATHYGRIEENDSDSPVHSVPLETVVEAVAYDLDHFKYSVKLGQKIERSIKQSFPKSQADKIIKKLRNDYPLQLTEEKADEPSRRFFKLMKGKVINGYVVLKKIDDNDIRFQDYPGLETLKNLLKEWQSEMLISGKETFESWNGKQLCHKFQAKAEIIENNSETGNEFVGTFDARDFQNGELDWFSFDSSYTINSDHIENPSREGASIPINLTTPAMPDKRLFSFEDKKVDLGDMDIKADDLIRIMLLDFSLASGSDWYTVPLEMELGELCWIKKIEVFDVFGVKTIIKNGNGVGPSYADVDGDKKVTTLDTWDVFKIRKKPVTEYVRHENFLFVPPVVINRQESEPIEEILFFRDELSNMVWGVEKKVMNALGETVEGSDLHLKVYGPFQDSEDFDSDNDLPKYRLATTVPSNWIPYLPRKINKSEIELMKAALVSNEPGVPYRNLSPLSYLMQNELDTIREEAIPKAGVRIQLTRQRTRGADGRTYVWIGRKILPGRGAGHSGLRFDVME
jgi:hypothetical protein